MKMNPIYGLHVYNYQKPYWNQLEKTNDLVFIVREQDQAERIN